MRDALAERLLATVMNWDPGDVALERPILQALADLKYDAYQQYSPGMRFVESLALWLAQFETVEERRIAYDFVKRRLVFLSQEEMAHFAAVTYPDVVRPLLLDRAAIVENIPRHQLGRILKCETFSRLQRSSLFLGLSDGARIDLFRRSNRELSHEQIFQSYELASAKLAELSSTLISTNEGPPVPALVLLDDFSASGTSYFRREEHAFKGKIAKFLNLHSDRSNMADAGPHARDHGHCGALRCHRRRDRSDTGRSRRSSSGITAPSTSISRRFRGFRVGSKLPPLQASRLRRLRTCITTPRSRMNTPRREALI